MFAKVNGMAVIAAWLCGVTGWHMFVPGMVGSVTWMDGPGTPGGVGVLLVAGPGRDFTGGCCIACVAW